jgi:hypothetical protein
MEKLTLILDRRFSFKRDQTAELISLIAFVQGLALSFIANHGNPEICRSAGPLDKNF